jgi:hydroxyacylglutathione hydrolase
MIKVERFELGELQTNAYLLINEKTSKALVIDPGMNPRSLKNKIEKLSLDVEAILLTHAHFDHIAGVDELRSFTNAPVYIHPLEADWLSDPKKNGSLRWPEVTPPITTSPAEFDLAHGQILQLLDISIRVLHTPGHSPGSVSFLYENLLFGGDVLFRLSIGRSDLPGGNLRELSNSIRQTLFALPDNTTVFPGHGPNTTIGYERHHNPYVS